MTASANHNENVAVHVRNIGTLVRIKIRGRGGGPRPPTCIPTICVSNASPQSKLANFSVSARQQFYRCVTFQFFSGTLHRKADRAIFTKHFAAPHAACHKFCPTTVGRHNDCYQHMSQCFFIFFSFFFQPSFSPTKSLARDCLTRQPPGNAIYSLAAPDVQAKPGHIQASAPRGMAWEARKRRRINSWFPDLRRIQFSWLASNSSSQEWLSRVVLHPNEPKFASPNGRNAEKVHTFAAVPLTNIAGSWVTFFAVGNPECRKDISNTICHRNRWISLNDTVSAKARIAVVYVKVNLLWVSSLRGRRKQQFSRKRLTVRHFFAMFCQMFWNGVSSPHLILWIYNLSIQSTHNVCHPLCC